MKKRNFLFTIAIAGLLVACGNTNDPSASTPGTSDDQSVSVAGPSTSTPDSVAPSTSTSTVDPTPSASDKESAAPSTSSPAESESPSASIPDVPSVLPSTSVEEPPIPGGDTYTVYLSPINGVSWSVYNVHYWNDAGDESSWPGEMMSYDSDTGYYKYDIDIKYTGFLFNGGDDTHKTTDLTFNPSTPVYFLTSDSGAGQWGSIGEDPVIDPIPGGETYTVYLAPINGVSWPVYNVHYWNDYGDESSWPGEMMSFDLETGYYKYDIDTKYTGFLFNGGDDTYKTKDFTFDPSTPVYFLSSSNGAGQWGNIGDDPVIDPIPGGDTFTFYLSPVSGVSWTQYFVYTWNSGTNAPKVAWPGEVMSFDLETGNYKYEVEKNAYDKVIFSNGMNSTDPGAHQTKDLDFDYENPVFYLTSANGAGQWGGIGEDHNPSEVFKWYVIGEMSGWGVNDSYGMSSKGDNTFAYTGSFNAGVPFKIVSDSNDWFGGEKLDSASKAYVTIDTSDNNNMKFNISGTYTITWNASTQTITITAA